MLSYRHAFHAGNHADVLKHFLLVQMLRHLNQKEKPWWYIDTHAGAGFFPLDSAYARKKAEFASGIARLWPRTDLPEALADYVGLVRTANPDGRLRFYPGSPWFARQLQRDGGDQLRLFELHSSDSQLLQEHFRSAGRAVKIEASDGFNGLKSVLPPQPRRGLVLIDPPYEVKDDYRRVVEAMRDALQRFATGTYAVWYPQLSRRDPQQLLERLRHLPAKAWLHVALSVQAPALDGFGMHGSGLFIVNPPWVLAELLQRVMPYLVSVLGQDEHAGHTIEHQDA